ncbi:MAG: hypothetical protein LBL72_05455 [Candidatus Accumulibacter sp.]|jgi:hypothetical protein|nr:hypothetical protein [Accumulibacter sp.]
MSKIISFLGAKTTPWLVCGVLGAAALFAANSYLALRDEYTAYRARVEDAGHAARLAQESLRDAHEKTLEEVRKSYESQMETVRSGALAAYRLRDANPRSSTVCADAGGQPVDDDAERKRLADATLGNCAEDALKLAAWQAWCTKNQCPVED